MQPEIGASLVSPLAPEAIRWRVAELGDDGRARLEPYASREALVERFDEVCGLQGWSFTLAPFGDHALVANLTLSGVTRADVVRAEPILVERAAEVALARCADLFGVRLPFATHDPSYWVDYDPEAAGPLFEPAPVSVAAPAGAWHADEHFAPARSSAADPPANPPANGKPLAAVPAAGMSTVSNAGHEVIERLVERLKGAGLGKEAARLVVRYNGYGRTTEESRELYGRLRALLLTSGAEAT